MKDFINFDGNMFLNSAPQYGSDSSEYTNVNRINNLKKVKDISLELHKSELKGEEYYYIEDSKFSLINSTYELVYYNTYNTNEIFGDDIYYIILYLLEELLNIFSALNWGSVEKKSKKLIDTGGLESRFEEIGDNANCITKFFVMMRGKNYFFPLFFQC